MAHGDITHIDIPVSDTDRARDFYGTVFGWRIEDVPGFEDYPMWRGPNGIGGGALAPRGEGFTQPRSYVEVDSIDEALAAAVRGGGSVVAEKQPINETSSWAVFSDPDGNLIGIVEGDTEG